MLPDACVIELAVLTTLRSVSPVQLSILLINPPVLCSESTVWLTVELICCVAVTCEWVPSSIRWPLLIIVFRLLLRLFVKLASVSQVWRASFRMACNYQQLHAIL